MATTLSIIIGILLGIVFALGAIIHAIGDVFDMGMKTLWR